MTTALYPYLFPEPCWVAGGVHYADQAAAAATGRPVDQAEQRCVRAACFGCDVLVDLVAAHCTSWSAARHLAEQAGWHVEDHRRLMWCPPCYPTRPAGPAAPDHPHDPDQLALTDYVS